MRKHKHINYLLLPLSFLYGIAVGLRNFLFNRHFLKEESFDLPVISVGNLRTGGTGKTPHTEYLIRLLQRQYRIAVLSRGYKRATHGFLLADEKATSRTIGDEAYQMHLKFPGIQVAVDEKRVHGIQSLLSLSESRPQVILLDDAFQHRYVKPSLNILLSEYDRLFTEDALLPAGMLREPQEGKYRADIVIVTKCPGTIRPIDFRVTRKHLKLFPYQHLFFTSFEYKNLKPLFPDQQRTENDISLETLRQRKASVLALSGIDSPTNFVNEIRKYTDDCRLLQFSDHHNFSSFDIDKIRHSFAKMKNGYKIILTTEKDASRLFFNKKIPQEIKNRMYDLPIEVVFKGGKQDKFNQIIEDHVRNFKRNSSLA